MFPAIENLQADEPEEEPSVDDASNERGGVSRYDSRLKDMIDEKSEEVGVWRLYPTITAIPPSRRWPALACCDAGVNRPGIS